MDENENIYVITKEGYIYYLDKDMTILWERDVSQLISTPKIFCNSQVPIYDGLILYLYNERVDGLLGIDKNGDYTFFKDWIDVKGYPKIVDERGRIVFLTDEDKYTYITVTDNCGNVLLKKKFQGDILTIVALTGNHYLISRREQKSGEYINYIEVLDENLDKVISQVYPGRVYSFYFAGCGSLYFEDEGCVVKARIQGYGLGRSPWPMWRGDPQNTGRVQVYK